MTDYENIMTDEEFFGEEPEEGKVGFTIDSDGVAEWACKKIKKETEEHDRLVALAEEEIKGYKDKIELLDYQLERRTGYLKSKLYEYFNTVEHKDTKTQSSYKLLSGSLVFKKPTTKIKRPDDGKLLKILKGIDPLDTYVETIEKPKWAEFKKTLTLSDDGHVIDENGEIIESIEVEDLPGEFNVKL